MTLTAADPADIDIETALSAVLERGVEVVGRDASVYASTFPADVVRCRVDGGRELTILCKYEAGRRFSRFGHRGGPGYEALVYREVVTPLAAPAPAFYGSWPAPDGQGTWLFLEYLDGCRRLSEGVWAAADLVRTAAWAGGFHAAAEAAPEVAARLTAYDDDYYARWARRASELAGSERHRRYPWLAGLCARAEQPLRALPARPRTVIHGELTPHNVLVHEDEIRPVDWETAALAPGEVDLASLTEGWPDAVVAGCDAAYSHARWPSGAPASHRETLHLARLYWSLRWLGDRAEWLSQPKMALRYERLHATGVRLGLT